MKEKIFFVRYEKFNNSNCVNKLPYEGKSFFVIKSIHDKRYKNFISAETHNLDLNDFTILSAEGIDKNKVKALNYKDVCNYVLGKSNKIPELIDFNPKEHICDWVVNSSVQLGLTKNEIESFGGCYYYPVHKFQVLIID